MRLPPATLAPSLRRHATPFLIFPHETQQVPQRALLRLLVPSGHGRRLQPTLPSPTAEKGEYPPSACSSSFSPRHINDLKGAFYPPHAGAPHLSGNLPLQKSLPLPMPSLDGGGDACASRSAALPPEPRPRDSERGPPASFAAASPAPHTRPLQMQAMNDRANKSACSPMLCLAWRTRAA